MSIQTLTAIARLREVAGVAEVVATMKKMGWYVARTAPAGMDKFSKSKTPSGVLDFYQRWEGLTVGVALTLEGGKTKISWEYDFSVDGGEDEIPSLAKLQSEFQGAIAQLSSKLKTSISAAAKRCQEADKYLSQFVGDTPVEVPAADKKAGKEWTVPTLEDVRKKLKGLKLFEVYCTGGREEIVALVAASSVADAKKKAQKEYEMIAKSAQEVKNEKDWAETADNYDLDKEQIDDLTKHGMTVLGGGT